MNSAQGRSDANDYLEKRRTPPPPPLPPAENATGIPTGKRGREGGRMGKHFNCGAFKWHILSGWGVGRGRARRRKKAIVGLS